MMGTNSTKSQPWKAGWLARQAAGTEKKAVGGTSHGAPAGEKVILGGHTSGVSIKVNPEKQEWGWVRDISLDMDDRFTN
jgi:hypothetical protein